MNYFTVTLLLAGSCLAVSVQAGGLKEKKLWAGATTEVKTVQDEAQAACGNKVDFQFDQASFKATELEKHGMNGYCGDSFAAMKDLCADADYKEAMKTVKSLTCRFDGGAKKASASLKDGKLVFTFNWDTANHRSVVRKFLEDNL